MKQIIISIGIAIASIAALSSCEELLPYLDRGGNTPPTYAPGANDITFPSEGTTIVGTLFLPETYEAGDQLPVIIVSGPWTQVRETVGYRYGRVLAEQGFATLAFDHRYWGESGGEPRYLESTHAKAQDVINAVFYLQDVSAVDADRIGVLGVCAGVGNVSLAVAADERIRAMATISPWVQAPETSPTLYGGEEGVHRRIELANEAQQQYQMTGVMPYVPAYDPNDPNAAMFFPVDYYADPQRGNIPEWTNRFAVAGWEEWLTLNTIDMAREVNVPTRIVYGTETYLTQNIEEYYALLGTEEKDSFLIEGEHTQFYDQDPYVTNTAIRAAEHFREHL